ncbi:enoyl-CoA hydratase-related protein [Candidatus Halocynthiibacter alkanivorans]|uniref:enoyl-CoA hydratase-related protein n=1 Tax=Candidatus Halocynthiibacter alkanivorans TaxID=2267619 RepID=UPI001359C7E8|nr:enoyl-CoA hydratase-related protein [Candidatus Halocynthiibacter alkanivorans]
MDEFLTIEQQAGLAIVDLARPFGAGWDADMRQALIEALEAVQQDGQVRAILLRSKGRNFAAPRRDGHPQYCAEKRDLAALCQGFESCRRPLVIALQGRVTGPGLELALAAHFRVALKGARFGMDQVLSGQVPGGGATQRLPRLTGAGPALDLMLSGQSISAEQARRIGLVDHISDGEDLIAWASAQRAFRPTRQRSRHLRDGAHYAAVVKEWRQGVSAMRLEAPAMILDCVEAALVLPFEAGLAREAAAWQDSCHSAQHRALTHLAWAESVTHQSNLSHGKDQEVQRVGVAGSGVGAVRFVQRALAHGLGISMAEPDEARRSVFLRRLAARFDDMLERGALGEDGIREQLERFNMVAGYAGLADAGFVVEFASGNGANGNGNGGGEIGYGGDRLAALDAALPAQVVLASSSAHLSLTQLRQGRDHPGRIAGFHPLAPSVVELALDGHNDARTVALCHAAALKLNCAGLESSGASGRIADRIIAALHRAVDLTLLAGATPTEVDAAMRGFGFAMGPCQARDAEGLERVAQRLRRHYGADATALCDAMRVQGRLGRRSGRGFYLWAEDRPGASDAGTLSVIAALRGDTAVRHFAAGDIQRRCLAAMINAGARALESGAVTRAGDIDLAAVVMPGFPRWKGGPMQAADHWGLPALQKELRHLALEAPDLWEPSPLLGHMIANGYHFGSEGSDQRNSK